MPLNCQLGRGISVDCTVGSTAVLHLHVLSADWITSFKVSQTESVLTIMLRAGQARPCVRSWRTHVAEASTWQTESSQAWQRPAEYKARRRIKQSLEWRHSGSCNRGRTCNCVES